MKKNLLSILACIGAFTFVNAQTQVLDDTDLELSGAGGTQWASTSSNFGSVICSTANCGSCGGPCTPNSGSFYAWFGGAGVSEKGTLSQSFSVGTAGGATLSFFLKIPNAGATSDSISAELDGANIWFKLGDDTTGFENSYAEVSVSIPSIAAGSHTLNFRGNETGTAGGTYNVLIDDITLSVFNNAGVSDLDFENGITTYVGYEQEQLTLILNFAEATDMVITITDMSGRTVDVKREKNVTNNSITYDTYAWATGVYNITFIKGANVITKKVLLK